MEIRKFRIFNRYGGLIHSEQLGLTWRGLEGNKQAAPGVYTYFMELQYFNETYFLKVDVTLVR